MKIAYFGSDQFLQCLELFSACQHSISAIFATAQDEHNVELGNYARQHNIPFHSGKPDQQQIQQLEDSGIDCFFSIEYDSLIPLPSAAVMTINVHPTLLPEGRGPTPLSHLILQYPQHAGVTFHKLSQRFDEGDIILQAPMTLDEHESLESLMVKLNYSIPQLLQQLLADLPQLYQNARPQAEGSYWPKLTDQDRIINWQQGIDEIQRMIRAYGRYGVIACIGHEAWLVNHIETHKTKHSSPPTSLLSEDHKTCSVAVADGFVIIYKDSILERRVLKKHS